MAGTADRTITIAPNSRFGSWLVIEVGEVRRGSRYWQCLCSCGKIGLIRGTELRSGRSVGCGHDNRYRPVTHGQYGSPTYWSWVNLKRRCLDPKHPAYPHYGGRGILVCERWMSFENFRADMGDKPSRLHSIDRIDNDGDYTPDNCKWSEPLEQMNNRRCSHFLTLKGRTQTLSMWAREVGIPVATLAGRLRRGWPLDKALGGQEKENIC